LINGVVALTLNVGLNYVLIPKYGMLGAATATGVTLAAWSIWRIVEVWFMFRCFPFTRPTWVVGGVAVLGAAAIHTSSLNTISTLGATVVLLLLFFALAFTMARGPEDRAVLERIKSKLQRRR
jgi:O-antigen/teichoic acid export membrane protein